MKNFRAELHTHTVLSPCASIEMIPPLIIAEAESKNIDILAITDHNSIANIQAVINAAAGSTVSIIPGIELQTQEEIHSICLFDTMPQAESFYASIETALPDLKNNADYFGEQFIVDQTGEFVRREERMLISSANLSITDAFYEVQRLGGLLIPAHVNRSAYGLLPVLGFVPQDIDLEILEVSKHIDPNEAFNEFPQLAGYHLIQNGDAHFLHEILGFNQFTVEEFSIQEMIKAMRGQDSRAYNNLYPVILDQNNFKQ
jgi:3',5'-nucleoside bisphosphate phosphatase